MDTGWLNCEDGDPNPTYHIREITANPYWLHAKVMGSKRKTKHRGPFNSNTCFNFGGNKTFFYKIIILIKTNSKLIEYLRLSLIISTNE
uniref:Uncharacterized protein n=1 Tax=Rhizophagus irregularis (strain DAOM 181602 / DAOM 197198 / MUCL 43194) TaxID=747089 RepID=U9T871_RHIID